MLSFVKYEEVHTHEAFCNLGSTAMQKSNGSCHVGGTHVY